MKKENIENNTDPSAENNKEAIGQISHQHDEANLEGLEDQPGENHSENNDSSSKPQKIFAWLATAAVIALIVIAGAIWIATKKAAPTDTEASSENSEKKESGGHSENETGEEVRLDAEALNSAGLQIVGATQRPAIAKLYVTGTVELNPEKTELATPLVGGRLENVFYGVGDYVERGAVLAVISSPQLAQLHGKMHEARTAYELAQRNLDRVQKSENRVAVLQAKAKLDEADATLRRTKRLIELGAGAGKDLIAAETVYRTAKADYDFQSNITLNKEIQEAKAAVETTYVDLHHIHDEMRSLGVNIRIDQPDDHSKDTSLVNVLAPLSGIVTERKFNAGAGIDAATPIFAISNLSTVYVIARVPEANLSRLAIGSTAEINSSAVGTINGRISYIDPQLDETTRTGRVRLEVNNPDGRLRAGMFTEVGFQTGTNEATGEEIVVPSDAIQREGEKTIVFVPKDSEPGTFEAREVEVGGETEGFTRIKNGLKVGEKIVTKGSFTLKTQMQKGEMGEH